MIRTSAILLAVGLMALMAVAVETTAQTGPASGPAARSLGVLEDFEGIPPGPYQKGFIDFWRWPAAERERRREMSRLEVVDGKAEGGGRCLRVEIRDGQLLAAEAIPILRLAPFYPPEADAIRVRVKVLAGTLRAYLGGPTAYYANSDVFTAIHVIRAEPTPAWVEVTFSLNHPLWRNFRRAGVSADAPRNYYNRWAQEPPGLWLADGTAGTFLIDRIELLALGEGRPFPTFDPAAVRTVRPIADFDDGRIDGAFNLYMADAETEWFEESWRRSKPLRFEPAKLSVVDGPPGRGKALAGTGRTAEEVHCTGIRTTGAAGANAIAITVRGDAPGERNTLLGGGPVVPVDFLVFVAPTAPPFAWERFGAPAELRALGGPGFDYQFSYRAIREVRDASFAIYQTRRYLKPGEWTPLVLPTADFTCVYGHGAYRERFLKHHPLTSEDMVAVAWLNPWPRTGRRSPEATTRVDDLAFVHVPGTAAEHRSFWQIPSPEAVELVDRPGPGAKVRHMLLSAEKESTQDVEHRE